MIKLWSECFLAWYKEAIKDALQILREKSEASHIIKFRVAQEFLQRRNS